MEFTDGVLFLGAFCHSATDVTDSVVGFEGAFGIVGAGWSSRRKRTHIVARIYVGRITWLQEFIEA